MLSQAQVKSLVPAPKKFYVSEDTRAKLVMLAKRRADGYNSNCLVKGQQGCGKTELASQWAAALEAPFISVEVGLLQEAGQMFGQQTLSKGEVVYETFRLADAIQVTGMVVLLDEINRAERPEALNDLFSLLDDRRMVWIDALKEEVKVAPGVTFFASINEGIQFTGTKELDSAIRDRFFTIEMTYPPLPVEAELFEQRMHMNKEESNKLATICATARKRDIELSTRKGIQIAECLNYGLSWSRAIQFSLGINLSAVEDILLELHLQGEQLEVLETNWVELVN